MLQSEVFYITPISIVDTVGIHQLVLENTEEFKVYLPVTTAQNTTLEDSKTFVENKINKFLDKEQFLFVIKEKVSDTVSGLVYIKDLDWNKLQAEFGYCLTAKKHGQGWMTKTIQLLSEYAFEILGLKSMVIKVYKNNVGSVKVAEKCGFKWKETLLNEFKPKDRPAMDMELYVLEK